MDERDLLSLNAYIDGELTPTETRTFEARLSVEPELAAELARTQAIVALLGMAEPLRAPRSFALDPAVYGRTSQRSGGPLNWLAPRGALRPVLAGASLLTSLILFGVAFLSFTGGRSMNMAMEPAPAMEAAEMDYAAESDSMPADAQAMPITSITEELAQEEMAEEAPMEEAAPAEEEMAAEAEMAPSEEMAADSAVPEFSPTAMPTPLPTQPLIPNDEAGSDGLGAGEPSFTAETAEPLSEAAPAPEVAESEEGEVSPDARSGDMDESSTDGSAMTITEDQAGDSEDVTAADIMIEEPQAVRSLEDDIQRSMRRSIALIVIAVITAVVGITLLIPPKPQAYE